MQDKILIAEYRLGLEAEMFWNSELGHYLKGVSEQEIAEAKEALTYVDADDTKAVKDLQNKIHIAKSALGWVHEAILRSMEAEEQLKQ